MVECCPGGAMRKKLTAGAVERRRFSPQERAAAVEMVRSSRLPVTTVAKKLGISDKTLNQWVVAARNSAVDPDGSMSDAAKRRIRELEDRVKKLERDLEFEKKAKAFIRNSSLRANGSK